MTSAPRRFSTSKQVRAVAVKIPSRVKRVSIKGRVRFSETKSRGWKNFFFTAAHHAKINVFVSSVCALLRSTCNHYQYQSVLRTPAARETRKNKTTEWVLLLYHPRSPSFFFLVNSTSSLTFFFFSQSLPLMILLNHKFTVKLVGRVE